MESPKTATPNSVNWVEYSITESAEAGAQLRSNSLPREQAKALVHHINKTNPNIGATHQTLDTKEGREHRVYIKDALEFTESFPVAKVARKGHADSHFRSGPKAKSHKAGGQVQPSVHFR